MLYHEANYAEDHTKDSFGAKSNFSDNEAHFVNIPFPFFSLLVGPLYHLQHPEEVPMATFIAETTLQPMSADMCCAYAASSSCFNTM